MSTAEFSKDGFSRRELFAFAKGRGRKGHTGRSEHKTPLPHPQPPERRGGITRRQAIPIIAAGTSVLAGGTVRLLDPWHWFNFKDQEIELYYPELQSFPVLSRGEFNTDHTHTKWFNLSRMNFNPDLATNTFKFFEDLVNSQKLIDYRSAKEIIPLSLDQRPRTERVIFFIPQNAPSPSWPDTAYGASTTGQFTNGPYVTFVRIPENGIGIPASMVFTTGELAANRAFAVEACQSSLSISSLSSELAQLGQEIFCNAYGAAFTLKQTGFTFDKYHSWAKDVLISKNSQSPSFPMYALSEQEYNQIPKIGQSISRR